MDESYCRCPGCGECSAHANASKLKAEIKRLKAKCTWVGLTAEEREQVQAESYGKVPHHVALIAAVEAKLKEKNT